MPVLQRPGERARGRRASRLRLEGRPLRRRSRRSRPARRPLGERLEEQVQRPSRARASRRRRRSSPARRGTRRAARRCRRRAAARAHAPGSAGRAAPRSSRPASASSRGSRGGSSSTSTPGGTTWHALQVPPGPTTSSSTRRMWRVPATTRIARAVVSDSRAHAGELLVPADRELELGAVRLDPERHRPTRCPDRRPEEHVVHEDDVGGKVLAQGGRVRLDEAVPLGPAEVLDGSAPRGPS